MENFSQLLLNIRDIHQSLQTSAANAVNQLLTIRNWLIGYYIVEFEQNGKDRAKYGDKLIKTIAGELKSIKGLDERSLRRFRQFYLSYPQIADTIRGTLSPVLQQFEIRGSLSPVLSGLKKVEHQTPQLQELFVPADKILSKLSYSHIELLLDIKEPLKQFVK